MGKWAQGEFDRVCAEKIKRLFYISAGVKNYDSAQEQAFKSFIKGLDVEDHAVQACFSSLVQRHKSAHRVPRAPRRSTTYRPYTAFDTSGVRDLPFPSSAVLSTHNPSIWPFINPTAGLDSSANADIQSASSAPVNPTASAVTAPDQPAMPSVASVIASRNDPTVQSQQALRYFEFPGFDILPPAPAQPSDSETNLYPPISEVIARIESPQTTSRSDSPQSLSRLRRGGSNAAARNTRTNRHDPIDFLSVYSSSRESTAQAEAVPPRPQRSPLFMGSPGSDTVAATSVLQEQIPPLPNEHSPPGSPSQAWLEEYTRANAAATSASTLNPQVGSPFPSFIFPSDDDYTVHAPHSREHATSVPIPMRRRRIRLEDDDAYRAGEGSRNVRPRIDPGRERTVRRTASFRALRRTRPASVGATENEDGSDNGLGMETDAGADGHWGDGLGHRDVERIAFDTEGDELYPFEPRTVEEWPFRSHGPSLSSLLRRQSRSQDVREAASGAVEAISRASSGLAIQGGRVADERDTRRDGVVSDLDAWNSGRSTSAAVQHQSSTSTVGPGIHSPFDDRLDIQRREHDRDRVPGQSPAYRRSLRTLREAQMFSARHGDPEEQAMGSEHQPLDIQDLLGLPGGYEVLYEEQARDAQYLDDEGNGIRREDAPGSRSR